MTDMFLLSDAQMARISPFFPLSHGVPRVDDRRVISGIIFVIRNGLRWRDVPPSYGPHKTIYNRFVRWSEMGVFGRIFVELAKGGGDTEDRGGSVCLNRFRAFRKWFSASVMLPPHPAPAG